MKATRSKPFETTPEMQIMIANRLACGNLWLTVEVMLLSSTPIGANITSLLEEDQFHGNFKILLLTRPNQRDALNLYSLDALNLYSHKFSKTRLY